MCAHAVPVRHWNDQNDSQPTQVRDHQSPCTPLTFFKTELAIDFDPRVPPTTTRDPSPTHSPTLSCSAQTSFLPRLIGNIIRVCQLVSSPISMMSALLAAALFLLLPPVSVRPSVSHSVWPFAVMSALLTVFVLREEEGISRSLGPPL